MELTGEPILVTVPRNVLQEFVSDKRKRKDPYFFAVFIVQWEFPASANDQWVHISMFKNTPEIWESWKAHTKDEARKPDAQVFHNLQTSQCHQTHKILPESIQTNADEAVCPICFTNPRNIVFFP